LLTGKVEGVGLNNIGPSRASGLEAGVAWTSNYEGGGIGARSVGTDRNDFSVTFWQRQKTHTCQKSSFAFHELERRQRQTSQALTFLSRSSQQN
jgi:hypothetical protein